MAITAGAQRGRAPYQINGAEATAPVALGASAQIVVASAVSGTTTLPTDAAGNAYACYRVTSSAAMWFGFGAGPATAGGGNGQWLITPGVIMDIWPPAGATQMSAIPADAVTAGSVSIAGLY